VKPLTAEDLNIVVVRKALTALRLVQSGDVEATDPVHALVADARAVLTNLDATLFELIKFLIMVEPVLEEGFTNCGEEPDCLWADPLMKARELKEAVKAYAVATRIMENT